MAAHTQNMIVVYVTNQEKEEIRLVAKAYAKSMSRYLLDLHFKNIESKRNKQNKAGVR